MARFSKRETAETVRDISEQLATLAREAELDALEHLLSMTMLEASNTLTELENARPAPLEFAGMDHYEDASHDIRSVVQTGA